MVLDDLIRDSPEWKGSKTEGQNIKENQRVDYAITPVKNNKQNEKQNKSDIKKMFESNDNAMLITEMRNM